MINITDKSKCTGCTACQQVCGKNAIVMQFDATGHQYPVMDAAKCIDCGLCEKVCPMLHTEELPRDEKLEDLPVYAAYNKDVEARSRSTSGGMFTVLSKYIIESGGVVYAARFNDSYHIYHDSFDNLNEIDPFRGSKYAQSELNDIFRRIKRDVKERKVLFVGTPCQVAGLKSFLRVDTPNLYTCDFICMCISSPKIWEEYLEEYWNVEQIKHIFFKDKRDSWHQWNMLIEDNRGEHLEKGRYNPFFKSYLNHNSARPSCFSCPFRKVRRVSDFTIADAWGIDKVMPDFDDDKGCTSLILQSSKAVEAYNEFKNDIESKEYPISDIVAYNPHILKEPAKSKEYKAFCEAYENKGIRAALDGNFTASTDCKIKYFIKKLKQWILK